MIVNKYYGLNLFRQIMHIICKLKFPRCICRYLNIKRHRYILRKLEPYFKIAQNYINNNVIDTHYNSYIIWMFWWQGSQKMPQIVSSCIKSIKQHYDSKRVILITKNNIQSYLNFPKYILNKVKNGNITLIHFSDLIRFKLLRRYGGLWIDSTVFCTSLINSKSFTHMYTSGGYKNPYKYYISAKWTGFLIGGNSNNNLFRFMDEFFKIYWLHHKYMIDYFLIDYGLYYAYLHNIGGFKYYVNTRAYKNNPHLPCLMSLLNKKYNINVFNKITSDSNLFKLTYKKYFVKNKDTFYHRINKQYNI